VRYLFSMVVSACVSVLSWQAMAYPPCDCTIYPFTPNPPCAQQCSTAILRHASSDSLQKLFGLREPAAQRIVAARRSGVQSLSEFKSALPPADVSQLERGFSHLSTDKLKSAPELRGLKAE
jgi:hypothetical protein